MVKIKNINELAKRIAWEMEQHGPSCSLNHLDVSAVDDMGVLFYESPFDGDISNWNVSNVRNMSHMFAKSAFTGDISRWNVSNVTDMSHMFSYSQFNGDLSTWNTSRVASMAGMFSQSFFNGDISGWDVSKVYNMSTMFEDSAFQGDLHRWRPAKGCALHRVFNYPHPSFFGIYALFQGYAELKENTPFGERYRAAIEQTRLLEIPYPANLFMVYQMVNTVSPQPPVIEEDLFNPTTR